ncbi:type IV toxin-antitoxin system AbiEi family antitoxin domain-containing protein [Jiangella endophytica]|uniref:type IV toxin-antitoxin system AbiEi family antitoxin domain-containing protein n=1 Tax=Jiangella endophytica TaxID=1623398 RepID=UPI0018E4F903|nr:type IV toxin-antitoxin system AbiEi family antitoxin domain-containing protein [Jiangella endophytica]
MATRWRRQRLMIMGTGRGCPQIAFRPWHPARPSTRLGDVGLPSDVTAIAAQQDGVISLQQAAAAGLTQRRIGWLVRSGRWQRVHARVYATFTGPLSYRGLVWAAILRAGRGAVASHRTAAYLDGLCDDPGPVVHVTAPADRHVRSRIDGVRVHYAHRLARTRHPTRVPPRTRTEETVLDLVDTTRRPQEVETWVTSACQRRRTTPERLRPPATAHGRRPRHLGGRRLRPLRGSGRARRPGRTPTKAGSATVTATTAPPPTAGPRCATGTPTSSATRAG